MCSWWWAEEPPETRRASVEINKSRNIVFVGCNLELYSRCTDIWISKIVLPYLNFQVVKQFRIIYSISPFETLSSVVLVCWVPKNETGGRRARMGEGEMHAWFEKPKTNRKIRISNCRSENNIKKYLTETVFGEQTGLIWPRIGTNIGLLWRRLWSFGFHKTQQISWLTKEFLDFSKMTLLFAFSYLVSYERMYGGGRGIAPRVRSLGNAWMYPGCW